MAELMQIDDRMVRDNFKQREKEENSAGLTIVRKYNKNEYLEKEIWMPVLNSDGRTRVSSFGRRMKVYKNGKEEIIDIKKESDLIFVSGGATRHMHIEVAKAFLACGRGDRVKRINRDIFDNKVDNLMFCKRGDVSSHLPIRREVSETKPLLQYNVNGGLLCRWENINQLVNATGFRAGDVLCSAEGYVAIAYGSLWMLDGIGDKAKYLPSLQDKINKIAPYLITARYGGNEMKCVGFAEASRLTGIDEYLIYRECFVHIPNGSDWTFSYNGKQYERGKVQWLS